MKRNPFLEQIRKDTPIETTLHIRHYADTVIRVNILLEKMGLLDDEVKSSKR